MPGIRQTSIEQVLKYQAEPAVVAEACIKTLKSTGRLKSAQRETGVITGIMGDKMLGFIPLWDTQIYIHIAADQTDTNVTVKLSRSAGLLEDGVIEKRMARFLDLLSKNSDLAGKSVGGGW